MCVSADGSKQANQAVSVKQSWPRQLSGSKNINLAGPTLRKCGPDQVSAHRDVTRWFVEFF